MAEELRCTTLSKHPIPANKLNVELAQGLFDAWTRFLPMDGAAFHVVIIEEFERVVSQEVKGYLKTALDWSVDADAGLPARCVVVATSNNVEKIEPALLERFEVLQFSGGPSFAELAQERLAEIWLAEMPGEDMPHGWRNWGRQGDRFSMRLALRELERHVKVEEPVPGGPGAAVPPLLGAATETDGRDLGQLHGRRGRVGIQEGPVPPAAGATPPPEPAPRRPPHHHPLRSRVPVHGGLHHGLQAAPDAGRDDPHPPAPPETPTPPTAGPCCNCSASSRNGPAGSPANAREAVVAILRQLGRPVSGTPPWGFQIVGPQGARRLEPDWEARAMMERIVRMHDMEGQGWAAIAQRIRADQAAARHHQLGEALRLEAHPAKARARNGTLFARQWSASTCARAARVFWQIVQTEGPDWISDIEVRRVAKSRADRLSPHAAQALNATTQVGT